MASHRTTPQVELPVGIGPREIREQMERILSSQPFRNSARLQRFLQFAVENSLSGHPEQLKEVILGREVFDRGVNYDPRVDSIVRVESQRLRRRLREYYESEGRNDPVSINFRAGSYVPLFESLQPVPEAMEETGPRASAQTIAVLPFENLSSDPEQEYFCDGVVEDIIHSLSCIPGLRVIGRTSVFALKGIAHDVRDSGARLGAGTVIDGSVRKAGNAVKIFVEMIDAGTGQVRWSQTFDRTIDDIFAVEEDIAKTVARVLQMTLAPPVFRRLVHGAPEMDAYLLYLRGRHAWNRMSVEGYGQAIDIFEQAVSLYPGYASAHAGLADAYSWFVLWGGARPRDYMSKAEQAAFRALRLDPLLPHACTAAAIAAACTDWNWAEALALARRALELEPSYGFGLQIMGFLLLATGQQDEAQDHFERSVMLDPLSVRANRTLGWSHYMQQRYTNAEKWLEAALVLDGDLVTSRYLLSRVYLAQGNVNAATDLMAKCIGDPVNPLALGLYGACLAKLGKREEAEDIVGKLSALSEARYVDPQALAHVRMALGQYNLAMESVRQILEERTPYAPFLDPDPEFEPLRANPEFHDAIAQIHAVR